MFLEIRAVGMRDGDVVVETGAAEHEALFHAGGLAEELEGVVREDAHYEFVEGFAFRGGAGVFSLFWGGGDGFEDYAFGGALEDFGDVGVEADGDAFGDEVGAPGFVEGVEVGEGDHGGEVGEESFRVVVPEFHVGVVEEAFEDCAGDVGGLVAGAKEEGDEGEDHFVAEVFAEEEEAEHDADGDYA